MYCATLTHPTNNSIQLLITICNQVEKSMKPRNIEKILAIGFLPVSIELTDKAWAIANEYEDICTRISSPLWLRHIPLVGDEILLPSDVTSLRGTVIKRAFAFLDDVFPNLGNTMLYLLVDNLVLCDSKSTGIVWETSLDLQKTIASPVDISRALKVNAD
jgi:hypothetical protein